MIEVKADALETTFSGVELGGAVARPLLSGARAGAGAAFGGFLRSGTSVEMKSFTGVSGDSGGYAIPKEIDAVIGATLASVSPIRSIANVVQVGSAGYRKLVTAGGTPSGWASEVDARPATGTPTYFEIAPPMGDLYANPSASQAMLDDALFDVEGWLATEIAREFARAEGAAFVNGSGVGRPKGFLAAPTSSANDAARAFGTLQYLASGAAGDFAASPQDRLIDLVQSLRGPYRQNGTWVMNSATLARIRKFKTSDGAFIWTPGLSVGQPATLLGYGGGLLRWFGGANSGLEAAIAASEGAVVTLRTEPVFAPATGDLIELIEGCDKSLATCASRFANAANFRGEPYLPGIDLLTRYPGA
jgi:HK97 family phage major capsid protein